MSAALDLLVVGGGPGGAALATLAARAGLRVLVVERERFPRDKVCGGFVSAEGCAVLERLSALSPLVELGARWIDRCGVAVGPQGRLEAPLPDLGGGRRAGLGVSRERLDATLLDHARTLGASVLERHLAVPLERAGRTRAAAVRPVGSDRPAERVEARVVVDASGRARAFAPRATGRRRTGDRSWFGFATKLPGGAATLDRCVELHAFDGGYVGLCAIEAQRTTACLLVRVGALRAAGGDPARLFAERVIAEASVRRALGESRPCAPWRAVGPLHWGIGAPADRGILSVGDAAGTIDPLCGEGMSHALRAAEIALPFVVRATERGGVDEEIERAYRAAWSAEFRRPMRRARILGFVLERRSLARIVLAALTSGTAPLVRPLVAWSRTGLGPRRRAERLSARPAAGSPCARPPTTRATGSRPRPAPGPSPTSRDA